MSYQDGADYVIAEKNARLNAARDENVRLIEERDEANRIAAEQAARAERLNDQATADAELVALLLAEARLAVKAITAAGTLAAESNSFHGQLDEDYAAWQRSRAELRAAVLGRLEAERGSE